MDVFGAFLQLRERRQRVAGLGIAGIVHLDQDGAIALDDEGIAGVVIHSVSTCRQGAVQRSRIPKKRSLVGWEKPRKARCEYPTREHLAHHSIILPTPSA